MIAFCYQTLQAINFTMKEGREVLNGLAGILSTPSSCSHLLLFAPVNRSALNVYDVRKNHVHKTRFKVESNLVVYRDLYHINGTQQRVHFLLNESNVPLNSIKLRGLRAFRHIILHRIKFLRYHRKNGS